MDDDGLNVPEHLQAPLLEALFRVGDALPKEIPMDEDGLDAYQTLERELVREELRKDPRLEPYLDGPDLPPELEAELIVLGADPDIEVGLRAFIGRQKIRTEEFGNERAVELGMAELRGATAGVEYGLDAAFKSALKRIDVEDTLGRGRRGVLFNREMEARPEIADRLRAVWNSELKGMVTPEVLRRLRDAMLELDDPSLGPG